MSAYDLTGSGLQTLTTATSRLFVSVTSLPYGTGTGRSNPENLFDCALLRFGISGYFYPARPVDGEQIVLDVPPGTDTLGYAVFPGGELHVSEDTP